MLVGGGSGLGRSYSSNLRIGFLMLLSPLTNLVAVLADV